MAKKRQSSRLPDIVYRQNRHSRCNSLLLLHAVCVRRHKASSLYSGIDKYDALVHVPQKAKAYTSTKFIFKARHSTDTISFLCARVWLANKKCSVTHVVFRFARKSGATGLWLRRRQQLERWTDAILSSRSEQVLLRTHMLQQQQRCICVQDVQLLRNTAAADRRARWSSNANA